MIARVGALLLLSQVSLLGAAVPSPVSGALAESGSYGTVSFSATASSTAASISKVVYYLDGAFLASRTSSPYRVLYDSTNLADGSHSLTAYATDASGNSSYLQPQPLAFTVSNPLVEGENQYLVARLLDPRQIRLNVSSSLPAGLYTISRTALDTSTTTTLTTTLGPGSVYTDSGIPEGHRYEYTLSDATGETQDAVDLSSPDVRFTDRSISVTWPDGSPSLTDSGLADDGGTSYLGVSSGLTTTYSGLSPLKMYTLRWQSVESARTLRIQTLPEGPNVYVSSDHYAPGQMVDIHAFGSDSTQPLSIRVQRLYPNPVIFTTTSTPWTDIQTPYAGSVYGFEWPVSYSFGLPTNAVSGYYEVEVGYPSTGGTVTYSAAAGFVVEPSTISSNRLLLVANTFTWAAYNDAGGVSFYNNYLMYPFSQKAPLDGSEAPMPVLSFQRPNPRSNHFFTVSRWGEHQELFLPIWLNAGGRNIGYDIVSDETLGKLDPSALAKQYDTIVLQAHPEYWSVEEEATLQHFVQDGGNLICLAGNVGYCHVALSPDGTTLSRTERPRNLTQVQAMIGLSSSDISYPGANFSVDNPSHWAFQGFLKNTGFPVGTFGNGGDIGGGSGGEVDRIGPNSPSGLLLLAEGTNAKSSSRAQAVIFGYPNGGGTVFNLGSIAFTLTLFSDPNSSVVLGNLLAHLAPRALPLFGTISETGTSGTLTMNAYAYASAGVQSVAYFIDGTAVSTQRTSPYTATFDSAKLSNGSHSLSAVATDSLGHTGVLSPKSLAFTVSNPTGTVSEAGAMGTISFTATASDPGGVISKVTYYLDGNWFASRTAAPYAISCDSTKLTNGTHSLLAFATDALGHIGYLSPRPLSFTVSNESGALTESGSHGTITFSATASSPNSGVKLVTFYLDGAFLSTRTISPYVASYDSTKLTNGTHKVTAFARDGLNNYFYLTPRSLSFMIAN